MYNLKSLYNSFAVHPEGQWIMQPDNAQRLYKFVKEHPVKKVLDLGTGIGLSSSIIALALKEKGETDWHIDSVEQYEKCVKLAGDLIPEELKQGITIHQSKVTTWQTEQIPYQYFSTYESLPEGDYDLIVNDGPAPFVTEGHFVELDNGTVTKMLLEGKLKPGTFIVWDGRLNALKTLERYFGDNFYLVQPAGPVSDFNVIERKDNQVQFRDLRMEAMQETSYFKGLKVPA